MGSPTCRYCMQRADRCACEDPRIVGYENATPTPPAPADDATVKPGGLTHDEIRAACKNVGIDLSCGECASVFYTGTGAGASHTCRADDASGAEAKPIRWIACPNGDHYDERATTFDDEREAHRYAGDKNSEPVDGETWDVLPLYAAPLPARDDAVEDAREIDDERYSFFYAALAYAKARSLARTGGDAAIVGATDVIFDRAFENLGDDATWLTVAAERDAALRRAKGGTSG